MLIKAIKDSKIQGHDIFMDGNYEATKLDTLKYLIVTFGVVITRDEFVETFDIIKIDEEVIEPIVEEKLEEPQEVKEEVFEGLKTDEVDPINVEAQQIINQNELPTEEATQTESEVKTSEESTEVSTETGTEETGA